MTLPYSLVVSVLTAKKLFSVQIKGKGKRPISIKGSHCPHPNCALDIFRPRCLWVWLTPSDLSFNINIYTHIFQSLLIWLTIFFLFFFLFFFWFDWHFNEPLEIYSSRWSNRMDTFLYKNSLPFTVSNIYPISRCTYSNSLSIKMSITFQISRGSGAVILKERFFFFSFFF